MRALIPGYPVPLDYAEIFVATVNQPYPFTVNITDWEWWQLMHVVYQGSWTGPTPNNQLLKVVTSTLGTYIYGGNVTVAPPNTAFVHFGQGDQNPNPIGTAINNWMECPVSFGNGKFIIAEDGGDVGDVIAKLVYIIVGKRAGSKPLDVAWSPVT